ncbi:hypothetical protein H1R20_g15637, partial [Candolleomyces eurysporus]
MPSASYFKKARYFVANVISNTYISKGDALQYLHKHSATSAMHDSEERYPPPLCHEGTREVVISRIEAWYGFEVPPTKKVMWVHAPAGYGKTAVAGTISKKLESRMDLEFNPVGATFFFWRSSPERNSPARFIITLAYQLAISIPELAPHIEAAVKQNPMVLNKALEVQLMKLIVDPFRSLGELEDVPHRLVIVDGVDECINSDQESRVEKQYAEDQEGVQIRVLDLIFSLQSHNLPLCFLILSRPEPWIRQHIESGFFRAVTETLDLYQVGDHVKDVEKFVRDELAQIAESLEGRPPWPGEDIVQRFVWRTGGHMLYASTVIRHMADPYDDPRQRLEDILNSESNPASDLAHSTPFSSLHELYHQVLRSCPRTHRTIMVRVLEEILAARGHLSLKMGLHPAFNVLDRLSGRPLNRGINALRPLHAVIRLSDQDDGSCNNPSFFYHSSFAEFLEAEPQIFPDMTLNVQKGVSRLLAGCLESLLAITIDGQVCEEHLKFAVREWVGLWQKWRPSEEDDPSPLLKALRKIDLTAYFVQNLIGQDTWSINLWWCLQDLYHPTQNFIVRDMSFSACATLVEDALLHLRSSAEKFFLHVLHPDYFASHRLYTIPVPQFADDLGIYMVQISEHRAPAFDNVVKALRCLLEEQRELFGELEQRVLLYSWGDRPVIENMFMLARQKDIS